MVKFYRLNATGSHLVFQRLHLLCPFTFLTALSGGGKAAFVMPFCSSSPFKPDWEFDISKAR
jgi:hypothetical protein